MDIPFLIRSGIFLITGLITLIFPKQVFRWSSGVMKKLRIKHRNDEKYGIKSMKIFGVLCLITAIVLFVIAIR